MARSVWKGPFVDGYLLKKAEAARSSGRHEIIKMWSRRSTILPQFVGLTFGVYNGQKHIPVLVTEEMAVEHARRRELAELVADHFLGDEHRYVLLPVVDPEGEADELRQDGGAPAPDLDHLVASRRARGFRLLEEVAVDEGTFPDRTRHGSFLFLLLPLVAA